MSTYLVLCQNMARDVGIPGSGPSSVTSASLSEEENAVVRYVRAADLDIQSRWFDWQYHQGFTELLLLELRCIMQRMKMLQK